MQMTLSLCSPPPRMGWMGPVATARSAEFRRWVHQGRCFTKLRIGDQKKWHRNFTFGYLAIIGASLRAWF
jgi:hypothetical protein